jgi:hypothetical protein
MTLIQGHQAACPLIVSYTAANGEAAEFSVETSD